MYVFVYKYINTCIHKHTPKHRHRITANKHIDGWVVVRAFRLLDELFISSWSRFYGTIISADRSLNALNLRPVDRQQQQQARELIGQANNLVRDLMNAASDFYSHSEQRAKLLSSSTDSERLAEVNKQVSNCLPNGKGLASVSSSIGDVRYASFIII